MSIHKNAALNEIIKEMEMEIEGLIQELYPQATPTRRSISLAQDLKAEKEIPNIRFDRIYPKMIRKMSSTHWTPVEIAQKAANLLTTPNHLKVLDVGSGCGKFCIVGALTKPAAHFYGIEQRTYLTALARKAALDLEVQNTTFFDGNMLDLDWNDYDSFYLFNPFWEHRMSPFLRIDQGLQTSETKFEAYTSGVESKLCQLKSGTRVVTYHGFGGRFPDSYQCKFSESCGSDQIELWIKK